MVDVEFGLLDTAANSQNEAVRIQNEAVSFRNEAVKRTSAP